ncbi:MAG TPA: 2'-5' RNA ligase family protein [Micromonosporaceae bacterium]|nr:2'-5' RNA ligase family protein [Micromonosporaceae bacterium]
MATSTVGVAIDIPEPWGAQLTQRRKEAGDPVAEYVPAHLTLLGPTEIDPGRFDQVETHLAAVAAASRPFPVLLRGTGTFRPVTEVVFVAVAAGIAECEQLAAAIREPDVLQREQRFPYHPHVTVAQQVPTAELDAVFEDLADFTARFAVDGFTLFAHGPDGRWHPRRHFWLGRP